MSFLRFFYQFFGANMEKYLKIILYWQGSLYYSLRVFFFFSILFRHANLSRVHIRNQHRSKLQTLVSSYHSKTSAQRSPSLAICTNSQDLSFFLLSEHFSAKITCAPRNENIENIENMTLSLLYNYSFSYSHFEYPMRISNSPNSPNSQYSQFSLHAPNRLNYPIQFPFYDIVHVQSY